MDFHHCKMVFLQYRVGKSVRDATNKRLKELRAERDQAMKGENTKSKQYIFDEWHDILDAENEDLLSVGAYFNFSKLHIMSHFASLIPLFGTPS